MFNFILHGAKRVVQCNHYKKYGFSGWICSCHFCTIQYNNNEHEAENLLRQFCCASVMKSKRLRVEQCHTIGITKKFFFITKAFVENKNVIKRTLTNIVLSSLLFFFYVLETEEQKKQQLKTKNDCCTTWEDGFRSFYLFIVSFKDSCHQCQCTARCKFCDVSVNRAHCLFVWEYIIHIYERTDTKCQCPKFKNQFCFILASLQRRRLPLSCSENR